MIRLPLLLSLVFLGCQPNIGQTFDPAKMNELFDRIEAADKGMGSVSVFDQGTEVYQRTIGFANLKDQTRPDSETQYRVGSITKMLTSVITQQLIETGDLTLDTTLDAFFPEVQHSGIITIEQLLRHRSGIFNMTSAKDYHKWETFALSKEKLVKKIIKYGSVFKPDTKAEYSNSNYVLLTLIAEEITGREYPDLVAGIASKCGLQRTEVGGKISGNQALSYYRQGDEWQLARETHMSVPLGAGALISTPTDLNRFLRCLFEGELISTESLTQMKEIVDGFGMGLFQAPFYDKKAFGHTGGIDEFQATAFYFPKEGVSVVYTSNGVVTSVNDILIGILSIYFGRDYELPTFTQGISVAAKELDQYLGVYSDASFPLKITITKEGNQLIGQATGQGAFPLEAYDTHKFRFEQAALTMKFQPDEATMIFEQGGSEFTLKRE